MMSGLLNRTWGDPVVVVDTDDVDDMAVDSRAVRDVEFIVDVAVDVEAESDVAGVGVTGSVGTRGTCDSGGVRGRRSCDSGGNPADADASVDEELDVVVLWSSI